MEATRWPEVATRFSRLTPTGFPFELTWTGDRNSLRWTVEVAGAELPDSERLGLVAQSMRAADQELPRGVLDRLAALQHGRALAYGAWLGGRSAPGAETRYKLYAELPEGVTASALPLPAALARAAARLPPWAAARMLGVMPALERCELYLRLGTLDVDGLERVLIALDQACALETLKRALPDGLSRLAGRNLGISLASSSDDAVDVALFASARTLFPGSPQLLAALVPALPALATGVACPTLVSLQLAARGQALACAVGMSIKSEASAPGTECARPLRATG